jgi:hypothetical protein
VGRWAHFCEWPDGTPNTPSLVAAVGDESALVCAVTMVAEGGGLVGDD